MLNTMPSPQIDSPRKKSPKIRLPKWLDPLHQGFWCMADGNNSIGIDNIWILPWRFPQRDPENSWFIIENPINTM